MGKLQVFSIQFANNTDVFMPGQWMTGQVVVDLNDEMKMRGIRLKFKGKGHVEWREDEQVHDGGETRTEEERYWADEEYFDQEITVFGKASGQSGDNPTLDAGHHVFPFQYQLPQHGLPTSFEGAHGYIRYYVKGTIDKPWKFDHNTKRAFTVLDMVDLNQEPTATTSLSGQKFKTLCCLCCASGPIELQVQADRSAYCPGERIVISGSIENNSNSRISKVKAKFKQEVVYSAGHPHHKTRPNTKDLSTAEGQGCDEGGSVDVNLSLPVPAIPPSNLRYCNIIDLKYKLDISAHFDGAHTSMDLDFPILVGSIPLRSIYPTAPTFPPPPFPPGSDAAYRNPGAYPPPNPGAYPPPDPGAYPPPNPGAYPPPNPGGYPPPDPGAYPPPNSGAYPPPNPGAYPPANPGAPYPPTGPDAVYPPAPGAPYVPPDGGLSPPPVIMPGGGTPNLPPPSYMQSVFGASNIMDGDDNEHIRGTLDYAPKYAYYDWSQHPQI